MPPRLRGKSCRQLQPSHNKVHRVRDRETTIEVKFVVLRGPGIVGREEKCPKMPFFLGKRHDNKTLNAHNVLSELLLSLHRVPQGQQHQREGGLELQEGKRPRPPRQLPKHPLPLHYRIPPCQTNKKVPQQKADWVLSSTRSALSKTGHVLSKAEISEVGVFPSFKWDVQLLHGLPPNKKGGCSASPKGQIW